jgi:hypothetical protein
MEGRPNNLKLHKLIGERLEIPWQCHIDHKDQDTLNNKRENLRPATPSQNASNKRKTWKGSLKFKGVHFDKGNKATPWRAKIWRNEKSIHIGRFKTEIEAATAYDLKALELQDDYACLNFKECKQEYLDRLKQNVPT